VITGAGGLPPAPTGAARPIRRERGRRTVPVPSPGSWPDRWPSTDVDLEALAATTPGMVGADLANLANQAVLPAARRNHRTVQAPDFTDSLEKILLGAPRSRARWSAGGV
jgi:SpoVK/Ycf46/Vps4 family AAA+-type ATPase